MPPSRAAIRCRHPMRPHAAILCCHRVLPSRAAIQEDVWFQPIVFWAVLYMQTGHAAIPCRHPVPPSYAVLSMLQSCAAILCRHPAPSSGCMVPAHDLVLVLFDIYLQTEDAASPCCHPVLPSSYATILCRHPGILMIPVFCAAILCRHPVMPSGYMLWFQLMVFWPVIYLQTGDAALPCHHR